MKQKGFTLIELMAVVAIIGILAVASLPVFNHYIEKTKAAAGVAALGTYKNDVAMCFMHEDTLNGCNDGREGIHPADVKINWIDDVTVTNGIVTAFLEAENHFQNSDRVVVQLDPTGVDPSDAAMNWTLRCSDYDPVGGTHLINSCSSGLSAPNGQVNAPGPGPDQCFVNGSWIPCLLADIIVLNPAE